MHEIINISTICFTIILVGLVMGFSLLQIQNNI